LASEVPGLRRAVLRSAAHGQAAHSRQHCDAVAHALLLLVHGLRRCDRLRQSYAAFAGCPGVVALRGLARTDAPEEERRAVSFSQVAASTPTRPAALLAGLVPILATRLRPAGRVTDVPAPLDLHAIDSPGVRVSGRLARWPAGCRPPNRPRILVSAPRCKTRPPATCRRCSA